MDKEQVIEELCLLGSQVGAEVFNHKVAHDCFCQHATGTFNFQFDQEVLDFIKGAVEDKIKLYQNVQELN